MSDQVWKRMTITLLEEEVLALRQLASEEHRDMQQQVAWMVRKELSRMNLLGTKQNNGDENSPVVYYSE